VHVPTLVPGTRSLVTSVLIILFAGLFTPFVYGPAKAESLGSSAKQASLLLSVLGACNTVSRIITGFIADLPQVDCVLVHNVAAILAGLFTCLVCVFNSYELLMVYSALFGTFIGKFPQLKA
jgi:predicted MFS family arabinose efflux permease